ncbi:PREDICTED: E3 ubiquitin-protein ligase HECW1-like, partial [Galeopterus variegatus]|uniref:E3 ubiquitin-protein ligase HECW1-like n=1 Tax=Galeopterus variegatus TaxID=482537 RepID=A0ABM0RSH7_GALVR
MACRSRRVPPSLACCPLALSPGVLQLLHRDLRLGLSLGLCSDVTLGRPQCLIPPRPMVSATIGTTTLFPVKTVPECRSILTLLAVSLPLQNLYQNRFLGLAAMASPSRNSQTRRRCKEPLRYSYNPDQFHNMDIRSSPQGSVTIPRSTSDTDLVTSDSRSTLMVSSSYYSIGHSQDLVIHWDIKEEVDAGDWIGMYLIDEVLSENFLDYKNRGVNGSHRGQIIWKIDASSYFVE